MLSTFLDPRVLERKNRRGIQVGECDRLIVGKDGRDSRFHAASPGAFPSTQIQAAVEMAKQFNSSGVHFQNIKADVAITHENIPGQPFKYL